MVCGVMGPLNQLIEYLPYSIFHRYNILWVLFILYTGCHILFYKLYLLSTHKAIAHRLMMQATFHFNIYIINCFFSFYLCAYMCWHWARIYFSSLKKIKNRNNSSQRSSLSVQNSHGHLWRFPKKKEKKKSENPRLWLPITVYPKHERGEKNNTKTH